MSESVNERIADAINLYVKSGYWLGAVVAWGDSNGRKGLVCSGTSGRRDGNEKLGPDSIFDMASVTKVLSVGISIARCYQDGLIDLDDPISKWPEIYRKDWPSDLTVKHLATHTSGFTNQIPDVKLTGKAALEDWLPKKSSYPPGTYFEYSCVNIVILGLILEKITGLPLAKQLDKNLVAPLGLKSLGFGPIPDGPNVVPTTPELVGRVNDPPARAVGFPVGNAGIFASVDDLSLVASQLLAKAVGKDSLLPLTVDAVHWMFQPLVFPNVVDRAVCWDRNSKMSVYDKPVWVSEKAIGHAGWTGQTFWLDPELDRWVIVLTNRTMMPQLYEAYSFFNPATRRARGTLADLIDTK